MGTMRPTAVVRGGSARHLSVPLSHKCAPQLLFAQKSSHLHRLELIGEGATIPSVDLDSPSSVTNVLLAAGHASRPRSKPSHP